MAAIVCISVLNYENVVETSSETDDDDRLLLSDDNGLPKGVGGDDEEASSPAGVPAPEASPRVAHALLSYHGQEVSETHQQGWRLRDGDAKGELP